MSQSYRIVDCLQTLQAALNVLLMLGSLVLIAIGIWISYYSDNYFYQMLIDSDIYSSMPTIMIALGSIIFGISILGFNSATRQKRILYLIYFITMVILLTSLIAGCILSIIFRETVERSLRMFMLNSIRSYDPSFPNNPTTMGWDYLQKEFDCCGIQPYDMGEDKHWMEWAENTKVNPYGEHRVPQSCCKMNFYTQERFDCNTKYFAVSDFVNEADCFDALQSIVIERSELTATVLTSAAVFLILCMIPALSLYCLLD